MQRDRDERHPLRNGVSLALIERERLALGAVTLLPVLAKAGCQTGIFGKWHLGDQEPCLPHKPAISGDLHPRRRRDRTGF